MMIIKFILCLVCLSTSAEAFDLIGTYSYYHKGVNGGDWSRTNIELSCDSTVLINRSFHMGETSWEGFWAVKDDTLRITVKPKFNADGKEISWGSGDTFLIKKNRIVPIITKWKGDKMKWKGKELNNQETVELWNKYLRKWHKYQKIESKDCK